MGKFIDINQLAAEYNDKIDIAALLAEIENWKESLSTTSWDDEITYSTLETVEDIIIDNLYKE